MPASPRMTSTPLRLPRASSSSRSRAWRALDRPRNAGGPWAVAISPQRYRGGPTRDIPGRDERPIAGPYLHQPRPQEVTMSTTELHTTATETSGIATVPMRFEVTALPVADVDRAKAFYQSIGWRL